MESNICLDSDSYKYSHHLQYPPNTTHVYSYIESRGGEFPLSMFFGTQMILRELQGLQVSMAKIKEAEEIIRAHGLPFHRQGWVDILRNHDGRLPIEIRAIPEGTVSPVKNYMMSVENTDPSAYWLTTFLETMVLRGTWYPTTVASQDFEVACTIYSYLKKTSDDPDGQLPFKHHCFASRGVSSRESAGIGGIARLAGMFRGTDTVEALRYGREFYGCEMPGYSIPAAEHSTITSWGRENETEAMRNMIKQFATPGSQVAVVSDSYDIYHACEYIWGEILKQEVLDSGATIIIRPDSGDPVEVVLKALKILARKFGGGNNDKGYYVLNPAIRLIQGDGVNRVTIRNILRAITEAGFSTDNIAFGSGGGALQQVDRDTMKFAMKCSQIQVRGESAPRPVYKQPITDPGKDSKKGRLTLVQNLDTGVYATASYPIAHGHRSAADQARVVFRDGEILVSETLDPIRARVESALKLQVEAVNYL